LKQREKRWLVLLGAVAAVAAVPGWRFLHRSPAAASASRSSQPQLEPVPRIDLERLPQERPELEVGRRDIFAFGPPPTVPPAPTPVTPLPTMPPLADPPAVGLAPATASRLPPLNLKFIGSVENGQGLRVAVLLTDRNELLTGQAGEVVANRYKIARIGFESVDLEEVGTGQVKRIPLRN